MGTKKVLAALPSFVEVERSYRKCDVITVKTPDLNLKSAHKSHVVHVIAVTVLRAVFPPSPWYDLN